jgi:hypothetical protein
MWERGMAVTLRKREKEGLLEGIPCHIEPHFHNRHMTEG